MTKTDCIYCISDLHLSYERPDVFEAFRSFLKTNANSARQLFILGDFFNLWIGDDDPAAFPWQVSKELSLLADSGTDIFIMHGNRDFLLGKEFCRLSQAVLIPEPYTLNCFNQQYLLMHGDSLCTRDESYMAFRNMVRNPDWQQAFLAKSIAERQAFAAQARQQSKDLSSNKAADIMDVTPTEVTKVLAENRQSILIHGHTHLPAIHELDLYGEHGKRIVLGDWDSSGWALKITPDGYTLEEFAI